ncbi:MAG: type II toxin-antitoxin system RelB/DinJ family antitoxin [Clostridia bacterium]|jgi:DNA-damage-inducible protein J|nr:type II toxin-antitoxin system RelB/DinJ family antitoxin [Clostridia bacterium]
MARTDNINIRVEPKLKKEVEETLNDLGMNITDAVTIFFKQIIMTESIPFMIRKPRLNAETIKAIEDAEKGINLSKGYTDLDEMWEDLEKEDE